jgi:glycogen operon protein
MTATNWDDPHARAIAVHLDGHDSPDIAPDGTPLIDDDLLICVNAWWEPLTMVIPSSLAATAWVRVVDSSDPAAGESASPPAPGDALAPGEAFTVAPRSTAVLRGRRDRP